MNEVILITILFLVVVSILVTLYRKQEERAVFRINELSASVTELSNTLKSFEDKFENYTDSFDQLLKLKIELLFDQNSNMEKQITGNLKAIKSSLDENHKVDALDISSV